MNILYVFEVPTYLIPLPGVKRPVVQYELNHSPPSSSDGKNERSYTSTPSVCLHGVDKEKPLPL
jgi:hypothetical protein